jgi:hypothetical protein
MVFHYLVALQKLQHDPYPSWQTATGIGCGPLGNNCAVEGDGRRGPGPVPLPARVRAKFRGLSRSHDGDHSLFDLHSARFALSGHSASHTLPSAQRGYGPGAYNSTPNSMYSLSHVQHAMGISPHNNSASMGISPHNNSASSSQPTNSFYGSISTHHSVSAQSMRGQTSHGNSGSVQSMWGQSSHGGQFSATSLVSQNDNSTFKLAFHEGVVSMASVAVVSRFTGHSGANSYSWDVKRANAPLQQHSSNGGKGLGVTGTTAYWSKSDSSAIIQGFLAPEPFTQYAAESPQGYSSI